MPRTFSCPLWPGCCPDGGVRHECPALRTAFELPEPSALDRIANYLATHHRIAAAVVIGMAWAASAYAGGPTP